MKKKLQNTAYRKKDAQATKGKEKNEKYVEEIEKLGRSIFEKVFL